MNNLRIDKAAKFTDGGAQVISCGNCGGTSPTVLTYWAWVLLTATTASRGIVVKGHATTNTGFAALYLVATARFQFQIDYSIADAQGITANNTALIGQRQFVLGTFDGTNSPELFLGTQNQRPANATSSRQAPTGTRVTDAGGPLNIGNFHSGGASPLVFGLPGSIFACGALSYVPRQEEIVAIWADTRATTRVPAGQWYPGSMAGGFVQDETGHGFTGVVTGAYSTMTNLPQPYARQKYWALSTGTPARGSFFPLMGGA